jgi:hypothetical protein
MPAEVLKAGRAWRPSPVWLPAYILCTLPHRNLVPKNPFNSPHIPEKIEVIGYGLENREDVDYNRKQQAVQDALPPDQRQAVAKRWQGWGFSASSKRTDYRLGSAAVGAALGLLYAVIISAGFGWITSGRRSKKSADVTVVKS